MSGDLHELLAQRDPSPSAVARVLAQTAELLRRHEKRLDAVYDRLLVVDELPNGAPFGALIRLRGDTVNLYLGHGDNRPLTRLTSEPL